MSNQWDLESMRKIMYPKESQYNFAGAEPIAHSYPGYQPPELDPKDERLLFLSEKNGYLAGRNSILEHANSSLEMRNQRLDDKVRELSGELNDERTAKEAERSRKWEAQTERDNLLKERADNLTQIASLKRRKK